ncbi:PTS transporter subunit EIIC [[Mycoplasma] mobile]|uniref:Pts system trehalose specific enzyme iibc n=1 Tax=Mycoplasma mobile (strain ATCC 43663 / 163K / NCTC 11711) TaxID=267748 RepID=Q6KIM8_MYCM1|nr:PTS transporter subunit EIIC [[Mycoplasma] mobile]AAT27548.1 pts system trehalose specific enzyme iibc [Mycoplasma mobile 163K]
MSEKSKYYEDVKSLILYLGGSENIISATNCVSRLRLVMKDMLLVDDKKIQELKSVKGTMKQPNNQYHVIIGSDVPIFYKEFEEQTNIKKVSKEELKKVAAGQGNWLQKALQHFSEIFIPIIPVVIASGLILSFRNILEANFGGFVFVQEYDFAAGLNEFLLAPALAGLWFLPVFISWSIFKKMGGTQTLGILIGLSLLIIPLVNVFETNNQGVKFIWEYDLNQFGFDFGVWKFPWKLAYTAQVIPAIGVAFLGVYLERWLTKIVAPVLRQIFVPLGVLLGSFIVGMVIIGPLGWIVGTSISIVVSLALTNGIAKYIFGPIFGFGYAFLVITGLHHSLNAVMIQNTATLNGSFIFPILAVSNITQGAAALMFTLLNRRSEKLKQIGYSATTSAWLGVTEPAMYGINLRYVYPFLAAATGSATGALLLTIAGVTSSGIGNGAWLGVLSMQASSAVVGVNTFAGTGFLWFMLSALLATAVTMVLTWFFGKLPRFKKIYDRVGIA